MGSGTRRRRSPAWKASQSTSTPASQSRPSAASTCSSSDCWARPSEGTTRRAAPRSGCCRARVESARPGPTSSRAGRGWRSSSPRPSAKRTVERRWRAQYAGSVAISAVIQAPVTFDRNGMRGGASAACATSSAKGSRTGSIIGEWKACEVRRRRVSTPLSASVERSAATASGGPATTHARGPLTAARASPGAVSDRNATTSSSGRETASIPPGGISPISRPRAATSRTASASGKTPARQAATYSPIEWPRRAAGRTPQSIHSCARACSTAKRAGCVSAVCASSAAAAAARSAAGKSTSRRSRPSSGRNRSQQRSSAARKTGSAR